MHFEPYQMQPAGALLNNSQALAALKAVFGERFHQNQPLERYTAARVGGAADTLIEATRRDELVKAVELMWRHNVPFTILGGGSNILVSDRGVRGVTVINRTRAVQFNEQSEPPRVWAESGANIGALARLAASHGFSGLEWAAGIPGTLGGAVVGNAGAHGGDTAGNLLVAEILQHGVGRASWPVERFEYAYRSSVFKRMPTASAPKAVVLAATLQLSRSTREAVQARMDELVAFRRRTQPPGASMGSMFKNPAGDYAGRLIEAAGLKGLQIGGAQISELHANFFTNLGQATARDVYRLIRKAQRAVREQTGISMELEVELVGDWADELAEIGNDD